MPLFYFRSSIPARILTSVLLLFSVLFFPFYVSILLALVSIFYFSFFGEAIFIFLLSDLLYGVEGGKFFETTFLSFILAILILIIVETIKKKLKFYP